MRKPAFAWALDGIREYLRDHVPWATAPLTGDILPDAFAIEDQYGARFWDALLLASANAADCDFFLSEDLSDGQTYGRVKAVNPFRHAVDDVLGAAARR